jgi:hypothetical protein
VLTTARTCNLKTGALGFDRRVDLGVDICESILEFCKGSGLKPIEDETLIKRKYAFVGICLDLESLSINVKLPEDNGKYLTWRQ